MKSSTVKNIRTQGNIIVDNIVVAIAQQLSTNRTIGWMIGFVAVAYSLMVRSDLYIGSDPAFYYITAEKILQGKHYYYNFFESNFPLNFYIYTIPVLISHITGISAITAILLFTTIVALTSIYCSSLLLKTTSIYQDGILYNFIIAGLFFGHFTPFSTFPNNEIGTKTLLYLAFILPYFFYVLTEIENIFLSKSTATIIGIFAGLVVAIKPHYALFIIFMELYILWRKKSLWYSLRPVNFAIVLVNIIHLLWLILFLPEYLFKVLPMVAVSYEGVSYEGVIEGIHFFRLILLREWLIIIFLVIAYKKFPRSEINNVLLVAVIASMAIFGSEGLGTWDQVSVLYFFNNLLLIKIVIDFIRSHMLLKIYIKALLILITSFFVFIFVFNLVPIQRYFKLYHSIIVMVEQISPLEPVLFLSDRIFAPINLYTGLPDDSKMPALSFWRGMQNNKNDADKTNNLKKKQIVQQTEKYFMDAINEALYHNPKMVFVSNRVKWGQLRDRCAIPNLDIFLENQTFRNKWRDYFFYTTIVEMDDKNLITDNIAVYIRRDNEYYWGATYLPKAIPLLNGYVL